MAHPPVDVIGPWKAALLMEFAGDAQLPGLVAAPNPGAGYTGFYKDEVKPPPRSGTPTVLQLYPCVVVTNQPARLFYALDGPPPSVIGWEIVGLCWGVDFGRTDALVVPIANRILAVAHSLNGRPGGGFIDSAIVEEPRAEAEIDVSGNPFRWQGARIRFRGQLAA